MASTSRCDPVGGQSPEPRKSSVAVRPTPETAGCGAYIGRVGTLAVVLGVGAAIFAVPAIAAADIGMADSIDSPSTSSLPKPRSGPRSPDSPANGRVRLDRRTAAPQKTPPVPEVTAWSRVSGSSSVTSGPDAIPPLSPASASGTKAIGANASVLDRSSRRDAVDTDPTPRVGSNQELAFPASSGPGRSEVPLSPSSLQSSAATRETDVSSSAPTAHPPFLLAESALAVPAPVQLASPESPASARPTQAASSGVLGWLGVEIGRAHV